MCSKQQQNIKIQYRNNCYFEDVLVCKKLSKIKMLKKLSALTNCGMKLKTLPFNTKHISGANKCKVTILKNSKNCCASDSKKNMANYKIEGQVTKFLRQHILYPKVLKPCTLVFGLELKYLSLWSIFKPIFPHCTTFWMTQYTKDCKDLTPTPTLWVVAKSVPRVHPL